MFIQLGEPFDAPPALRWAACSWQAAVIENLMRHYEARRMALSAVVCAQRK